MLNVIATKRHHHFTNITRKKYYYYDYNHSLQFYSASFIQNNNLYGKCVEIVFKIKTNLRRYSWTKVLLR